MATYSLNEITTVAQCDALLKKARLQHKTMLCRVMGLEVQIERFRDTLDMLRTQIVEQRDALKVAAITVAALPPESSAWRREERLRRMLEHRLFNTEQRLKKYPPEKLVDKEIDLQNLQTSLETQSMALASLEAHNILLQPPLTQQVVTAAGEKEIVQATSAVTKAVESPSITNDVPGFHKTRENALISAPQLCNSFTTKTQRAQRRK